MSCEQCKASTTDICNQNGCGYLESGNGAPAEPLHPHNDGLDEYRQPVHVGELDPAQRLALARGELK